MRLLWTVLVAVLLVAGCTDEPAETSLDREDAGPRTLQPASMVEREEERASMTDGQIYYYDVEPR